MLPKKQRISRALFGEIQSNKNRYKRVLHSLSFTLVVSREKDTSISNSFHAPPSLVRVSFVVSKKAVKKAVQRNRIRRRGYEAVRGFLPKMKPGAYIFYMKKEVLERSFGELQEEIQKLVLQ